MSPAPVIAASPRPHRRLPDERCWRYGVTESPGWRWSLTSPPATMRGIAETFCGDASLDDFIAAFNEIEDPSSISVGMELRIPSDCDG